MKLKLGTVAAAVALVWSFSSNAHALTINDPYVVGTVETAVPFGDASAATYVSTLLTLSANSTLTTGGQTYTTGNQNQATGGTGVLVNYHKDDTGNTSIAAGFEYVIAKYDGPNAGAIVFYLGGAAYTLPDDSSTIWLNKQSNGYGLSGWVAYNSTNCSDCIPVPDGGSTMTLLGSALFAFGMLARKFRNS